MPKYGPGLKEKMYKDKYTGEKYLKLELDENKRHFVFGDIHGRYDEMIKCLEQANYDPAGDVIYSVGDMIDRGPRNIDVLNFFLDNDFCYAVRGNHEDMVIDNNYHAVWLANGGLATYRELTMEALSVTQLGDLVSRLPYMIDVGNTEKLEGFRIFHAEIDPFYTENLIQLEMQEGTNETFIAHLLWGRSLITLFQKQMNANALNSCRQIADDLRTRQPVKTFVGHSWVTSPGVRIGNRFYIDTGMRTLTMINALTEETYHA